jgi:hypothetical protein
MSWTAVLDDYAHRLDEWEAALAAGREPEPGPAFSPPGPLGEMPEAFAARAQALLDRSAVLARRLAQAREDVRRELGRLPRVPVELRTGTRLDIGA